MRKHLLIGIILSISFSISAQKKSSVTDKSAIFDAYVQAGLKLWNTPGMSVAVIKDGKVVFK